MAFKGATRMNAGEMQSMNELLTLISTGDNKELKALAKSAVAKDSAEPTMTQQYQDAATQIRSKWNNAHRRNRKAASTVENKWNRKFGIANDGKEEEQKAVFDALDNEENAVSLRADQSNSRNTSGAKKTGLEAANAEYARRRGVNIAAVS